MSRRALTLPLRLASLSSPQSRQWICRRCLATAVEAEAPSAATHTQPPIPAPPSDSLRDTAPRRPHPYEPALPASQRLDPETGRPYPLTKTDRLLKKPLGEVIPIQHLQHSTSELLHPQEQAQRARTVQHRDVVGVVVSAGKMDKTVKVRVPGQRWEKKIGKYYASHTNHLVHDPNNSLVAGDVVKLHRLRVSKTVHHVVAEIVAPFGTPVAARPHIPTPDERLAAWKEHRFAKLQRRSLRREAAKGNADAIATLKSMGLDPGHGVEPGKGETANLQPHIGKTRDSGKGAILGRKGQKLPKGVLPGGKHEVGKIDERAKHNKEKAMKLDARAEENLLEVKEKAEELDQKRVGADPASSVTIPRQRVD